MVDVGPTLRRMILFAASHLRRDRALEVIVGVVTTIISAHNVMRMQFRLDILVVDAKLAR